ncbi:MAG: hypothetical protein KC468_19230, partial [Myxococcales bacterium]|nr:hypothetical protein [Myxococcales bacterium]
RNRPDRPLIRTMLRLSLPSCLQTLFFAAGYVALYWIIGHVGTDATGAANVLINVTMVAILPGLGLGLAAASLVGQALGKGDPEDARRWGWDVVKIGAVLMGLLGVPMLLIPDPILGIFLHEPEALALARLPLRLVGATIAVDAVGMILLNALMGAGDTRRVMLASVGLQWLLFLPAAYVLGPVLHLGLTEIWLANIAHRVLLALTMTLLWQRGRWQQIKL